MHSFEIWICLIRIWKSTAAVTPSSLVKCLGAQKLHQLLNSVDDNQMNAVNLPLIKIMNSWIEKLVRFCFIDLISVTALFLPKCSASVAHTD